MGIEENPFTPSFGEIPVYLAGRREIIDACSRAFLSERRRPELTTLFSGARGTGKTALLSYLAELAEQSGWIAVNVTALPGMLDDAEIQLRRNAAHLITPRGRPFDRKRRGSRPYIALHLGRRGAAKQLAIAH